MSSIGFYRFHKSVLPPGRVTVDRASYTASPSAQKLDVFASGAEIVSGRLPTQQRPAAVVTYQIAVTKVIHDYDSQTLTVSATSSDTVTPLALALDGFGALTAGTINDGPFTVVAGKPTTLPNLLDNDVDADGRADLIAAVQIVPQTGLTVSGGANGLATVTAAAAGTYAFTYKVQDAATSSFAGSSSVNITYK